MNHTGCRFRDKHTVGGIVFYKHAFLVLICEGFSYDIAHLYMYVVSLMFFVLVVFNYVLLYSCCISINM